MTEIHGIGKASPIAFRTAKADDPSPCDHTGEKKRGLCKGCYQKWRFRLMPKASCHPDRREHAGGLCRQCYRGGERAVRATCHPDRLVCARGLCRACYSELPDVKARAIRVRRLRKYKLSEAEYTKLLEAQRWQCAICFGEVQAVDHDHATGRVRGLLCAPCNMGLGHFSDDPVRMHSAIEYLRKAAL